MKKIESFLSLLWAVANLFVSRWKKKPPCCPCPYPAMEPFPSTPKSPKGDLTDL